MFSLLHFAFPLLMINLCGLTPPVNPSPAERGSIITVPDILNTSPEADDLGDDIALIV